MYSEQQKIFPPKMISNKVALKISAERVGCSMNGAGEESIFMYSMRNPYLILYTKANSNYINTEIQN